MRRAVPHAFVVILKDRIYRKYPRVQGADPKDFGGRNRCFVAFPHGIGRLLFESIDGPYPRHESVDDVHDHARGKQKGSDTQERHDPDQLYQNQVEGTVFRRTEKVIRTQQNQRKDGTRPRVA